MPEFLTFPIRSDKLAFRVGVTEHLFHRQSKFQSIDIYDTETFGRVLLLDGHVQLAEFDEHAYHESLVQIPLLAIRDPLSALVVGGGDGGVVRELCRSRSITQIDMVEIDRDVVSASVDWLPGLSEGSFDDPRVAVHIEDAFAFVQRCETSYDLIVVDSTDTYEEEEGALSEMLFTATFYEDCKKILKPDGFVVTQADNLIFCPYSLASIQQLFQTIFPNVGYFQALVPSFGGYSAFAWGSHDRDIKSVDPRFEGLRYLNPATYEIAFTPLGF